MEAGVGAVGEQAAERHGGSGPLPAALVLGATPVLKEPRLQSGRLFWLEQLPAERGRTTLRMRDRLGRQLELTPELDLRSRIHGYGGGVYTVSASPCVDGASTTGAMAGATGTGGGSTPLALNPSPPGGRPSEGVPPAPTPPEGMPSGPTVVVVAEGGRSLWRLDLPGDPTSAPLAAPVRLTPAPAASTEEGREPPLFADGLIDPLRQRWIGVCEQDGRDRLVSVPLSGGAPRVLWESPDFCGYAALNPSGSHLTWVSWQQPCMPWDRSQLWLGRFDANGALEDVRAIAGSSPGDEVAVSVFQPLWAGPDLVVANDRSGWWNLEQLENVDALATDAAPQWRPLLPLQAEFAMPQWVYGMRTTAWDGTRLVAACCRDGLWELGALVPAGEASTLPDPATAEDGMESARPAGTSDRSSPRPSAHACGAPTASPAGGLDASAAPAGAALAGMVPDDRGAADGSAARPGVDAPAIHAAPSAPGDRDGAEGHRRRVGASAAAGSGEARRGPWRWQPIPLPFDDLAALDAEAGTVVAIASGPHDGPGLLELTLHEPAGQDPGAATAAEAPASGMPQRAGSRSAHAHATWTHRLAAPALLAPERISRPEPLWFSGHADRPTHAWFYPPRGGASATSPLLLRGHSGPTGMARTGLSLAIQFWTSRGWGVVDVNYGGSTGFGRAYRERLDGLWSVVDVDDCLAAARAVVGSGRADPERIAMEGSSASGFTVLAAMARGDTLRAGAIRYPVTDLTTLAEGDHRFEARYFDALVGPWPEARALYEARSPLQQVDRIQAPLLFFHGLEDTVVPAQQSITMVERLKARGVPVELQLFEGEGHGFRDGAVQRQVLERSEAFFRERFQLPPHA